MARNTNAGVFTGTSKSSIFYKNNPEARAKKLAYDTKAGKKPAAIKKRGKEGAARVALGLTKGDGFDASATIVNGKTVFRKEKSEKNRGKTGDKEGASKGDKKSRPGKKLYASARNKKNKQNSNIT